MARHAPAPRHRRLVLTCLSLATVGLVVAAVLALARETGEHFSPPIRTTTAPSTTSYAPAIIPTIGVLPTTPPTTSSAPRPAPSTYTRTVVVTVTPELATPPPAPSAAPRTVVVTETVTRTVTETVTKTATETVTYTPPPIPEVPQ